MEQDLFFQLPDQEDIQVREERCQKVIKTVTKAIIMRLLICCLLVWVILRTDLALWTVGMMLLVMLLNLTGILPLAAELKKRRLEWKALLEEEET